MTTIKRTNSNDPDFVRLVDELNKYLANIFGVRQQYYDRLNVINNSSTVVVAYVNDETAGCGCLREFDAETIEVKRMFVTERYRGKGIGSHILVELEKWAREFGYKNIILETGTSLKEAIALYKKGGYQVTENWGEYVGIETSVCMKKTLENAGELKNYTK